METKLLERKTKNKFDKENLNRYCGDSSMSQAKADLERLEKSYRKSSRTLQSLVLGLIFAVLVFMAYGLFGTRLDREKFTTEVTPVHIELNTISDHRQTATNLRNMQM
jgi:hypothetical protein